jgi:hypothetical protein
MQVDVENRLASIRTGIEHQPVSAEMDALLFSQLAGNAYHVPQELLVFRTAVVQ